MSKYEIDIRDVPDLRAWIQHINTGATDAITIVDDNKTPLAEFRHPRSTFPTPAGWLVAGHSFNDAAIPAPFDSLAVQSNNIGASVWIHVASGAMIAAVPTATWDQPGQFAFYYAASTNGSPFELQAWTVEQRSWDTDSAAGYSRQHRLAIEYFNATMQAC